MRSSAAVLTFSLTACSLLAAAGTVFAEDWPEFRGPTRDGHSKATGLPTEWSEDTNVRWKVPVKGEGWSSPSVVAGKIYLTAAVPVEGGMERDRSLRTLCLNADDGATVWDVEVFKQEHDKVEKIHGKNSHASPTALVRDGRVYVHFGTQGTACLDTDGKILWTNREIIYKPQHGNGASPLLVDNALIFSCDGSDQQFFIALDASTGKILWKKDRPERANKFSFATAQLIEVNGQKQVISPSTNVVIAYDPKTGDELWNVNYQGFSVIPRPVFGHGMVYLTTSYGTPSLLAIKVDGKGDVTDSHITWQTNRSAPHTPSLLLVGDDLYCVSDNGVATCFDAKSGDVVWTKRIGGNYSASPLYAEGRIYFQDEKGEGIVIKAGHEFEEIARNKLPGRTLASYGVVDSALLIRTDTHLYRIENAK